MVLQIKREGFFDTLGYQIHWRNPGGDFFGHSSTVQKSPSLLISIFTLGSAPSATPP